VHVGVPSVSFTLLYYIGVFELNATHKHGKSQSNGHLPETINLEANNGVSEKWEIHEEREGHVCQIICTVIHRRRSPAAPSAKREEQN
jgi:hypothetical protein